MVRRGLVVLIVNLGLLEGLLWTVCPLPSSLQRPVRRAFIQTLPGLTPRILFTEDAFGFRSLSMRAIRKGPRTIRIICLGGSTTQQTTQSTEDLWSAVLERHLQAAVRGQGARIEVAALGQGGATVLDGVEECEQVLPPFDPDIVITLWGVNDLAWHGGPEYHYPDPARHAATTRWKRTLKRYSQLYRRFRQVEKLVKARNALHDGTSIEWASENVPALRASYRTYPYRETVLRDPDPIVEFADGTERLIRCLSRQGRAVIVLGQPVLWKSDLTREEQDALWFFVNTTEGRVRVSPAWLEREMARYNDVQRAKAQAQGASYIPLDRLIPKGLPYLYDDCHFTDLGSAAVAEAIFPVVQTEVERLMQRRGWKR